MGYPISLQIINPLLRQTNVAISSSGFFVMTGTSASSVGKPVTSNKNGFSSEGLFRMPFKNPIGLGVCERDESRVVEGGDQEPSGNPHRFVDVVIFHAPAIGKFAVVFSEDDDQVGGNFQEGFVLIRAKRCKGVQPFLRGAAAVELRLLLFRLHADLVFNPCITHDYKMPGL